MAKLLVELNGKEQSIEIKQEGSKLEADKDILDVTILAGRLLVGLADMLSRTENPKNIIKLRNLSNNLGIVLNKICDRGDR